MSRIPSPRGALTAASSAASPSLAVAGAAEDLVGEIEHLTPTGVELAAPTHVLRGRGGGDIERPRRRRPPIEQQRLELALLVEDADPADVRSVRPKRVSNRPKHSPLSATSSRFISLASARTSASRSTSVPPFLRSIGAPQRRACTCPSLARVQRRGGCRARPHSSVRTAVRLRTLELSHAPICPRVLASASDCAA